MNIETKISNSRLLYENSEYFPKFSQEYDTIEESKLSYITNYIRRKPILLVEDKFLLIDDQINLLYDFISMENITDIMLNNIFSYCLLLKTAFDKYLQVCQYDLLLLNQKIENGMLVDGTNYENSQTKIKADEIQRLFTDLYLIIITKNVGTKIIILCLFVIINIYKSFYCFKN